MLYGAENMPYREMAALIRMSGAELGKLGPQSDNPDELRSERGIEST